MCWRSARRARTSSWVVCSVMMVSCGWKRKEGRKAAIGSRRVGAGTQSAAAPALGDLAQLPLDGAGAAEQPPVHRLEPVVGRIEDEAAGHSDGNADGAPVELDGKSLGDHVTRLLASERGAPGLARRWL